MNWTRGHDAIADQGVGRELKAENSLLETFFNCASVQGEASHAWAVDAPSAIDLPSAKIAFE